RPRRAAPGGHQADGAVVVRGAESEAAVLLRDLHPPGAELVEALEERVVVLPLLVDLVGVDVLSEEALELGKELVGLGLVGRGLFGERMDEVGVEVAEEELADERRLLPLGLARGLGDSIASTAPCDLTSAMIRNSLEIWKVAQYE